MHPARWLETAFGSEARIRILRLLAAEPDSARSEREIAAAIDMSPNAVNRAIRSLREGSLVITEKVGTSSPSALPRRGVGCASPTAS